jgi:hypothetical protein
MRTAIAAVATACLLALAGCGSHQSQSATGSVHPVGWGKPAPKSAQLFGIAPSQTAAMFDTITLSTIPADPFALAGYTSGSWPNYLKLRAAYPTVHVVSIAVNASHHADCLDIEPGDAVPSQAAGWVRADIAAGFAKPCLYSSFWEFVNQVRPDLAAAGILRSQVFEWDADFTFVPHLDATFDATQWTDRALGRNLDESMVLLPFLSIAQPPLKPTPPLPVCIHRRMTVAKCAAVKAQIASWQRAGTSTRTALAAVEQGLAAHSCRVPYRRDVCIDLGRETAPVLRQRAAWFAAQTAALEAVS